MDNITFSSSKKSLMGNIINLMTLACLDGTVTDEENRLINDIANEYGLTKEEFDFCAEKANEGLKEGRSVVEIPEDDNDKTVFLKNLVMGMMCDGSIDPNEEEYVKFLANRFGFDADETVPYLIDSIVKEFTASDNIEQNILQAKEAFEQHDIPTAFDLLFKPAHLDHKALELFLRIPANEHWIRLLTEEQVDLLKEYAEKDYSVAQYTLGRYYHVVEAENDQARDLFLPAAKAGLADASAALAVMYRQGSLGEVEIDKGKYIESLKDASDKGSALAIYRLFKAVIFGQDGLEACPQGAIDNIKKWLNGDESEDLLKVDPMYYDLLALAYQELDDWKTAADYFMKSIQMGRIESLPDYLMFTSFNHDFELIDEEGYHQGIELGCKHGIPYCFLMRATENMDRYNNTDDEKEKERLHQLIAEDLNTASMGGEGDAAVQLGNHYYYGEYGFEMDDQLAWGQFLEGTGMGKAEAYSMLAQIVLDGNAPEDLPNNFVPYCRLMALRLGDDDQLIPVVMAYRSGALGKYKNEIERYYLPQYNALPDEKKATYFGLSFIAVINPEGTADLIAFDFDVEEWSEFAEIIEARQLDPIRSEALKL